MGPDPNHNHDSSIVDGRSTRVSNALLAIRVQGQRRYPLPAPPPAPAQTEAIRRLNPSLTYTLNEHM